MIIIVDTNIIISASLDTRSELYNVITSHSGKIDFIIPEFTITEILRNQRGIFAKSKKDAKTFAANLEALLHHIVVISDDELTNEHIQLAEKFTSQTDIDDTIFIAFALALDSLLWTGDRKLLKGVRKLGFINIVDTAQLKEIIKGL